ncbi:DUF4157 domain-containing protein [Dickeya dianthicola]|uniref:DUF4157 domain-containing protein n=1 Tax=Dickeya dianthicola TaxID=204039 RepID=A0AAX1C796_9GAMM|nr:DUF4157 domain-containing protein [Dickeya dianthicola]ATO32977.1 hypothetical protein DDI_1809 [Dickeya dianthicola RNS04.9]MBT1432060.1 DUF4157 domain-containing protein [Dickeya dianthicola]MCA7004874.1 DUF4157 domain-containing protein [Dickeya dianthicola]MCI4001280.1 DUF4157 domain-containing protein [Dickeya dianthicola]MCI4031235.1 DUF4157 domain-containing protein [Dickeya dianthicola]
MADFTSALRQQRHTQSATRSTPRQRGVTLPDNRPPVSSVGKTGLPSPLKSGMEQLSGQSLDHVRVHYNSDKPARYGAYAYAQGADIHLAPGQSHHLPHELGHVVQQAQGRVRATTQLHGAGINDDPSLEAEATRMGQQAQQMATAAPLTGDRGFAASSAGPVQRYAWPDAHQAIQRSVVSDFTFSLLKTHLLPLGLNNILLFADGQALKMLSHYASFGKIIDKATAFSNALSSAIGIWDALPAPVRTGILFLAGKVASYLPSQRAVSYSHSLLVAADEGAATHVLLQVVDILKIAINAANHPISSAVKFGQYLYANWWQGSGAENTPASTTGKQEKAASPDERKKALASLDLHIIWLKVGSVKLKNTQQDSDGKTTQGGLHAGFSLGYRLFDHEGSLGQNGKLTLILPWEGGAMLESQENINLIKEMVFGSELFVVRQLDMTSLSVSNEGLQQLGFSLKAFSIGNGAVLAKDIQASYQKNSGIIFAGHAGIGLYGWNAGANLALMLDDNGHFQSGSMDGFHESQGIVTIKQAAISKTGGLSLTNAELNLQPLTGLDIRGMIANLTVKNNEVAGAGSVTGQQIPLLGDQVILENVRGELSANAEGWQASASASLAIKAIGVKGEVNGVSIDHNGVNFTSAIVSGPQELTLFSGFTLERPQFLIEENGKSMTLTSDAALKLANVAGSAKQLRFGINADGVKGSVASASIKTSLFSLGMKAAQINRDGLHVDEAELTLLPNRSASDEKNMTAFIPGFNAGIMDFLPLDLVTFTVFDVDLTQKGLRVKTFRPTLNKLSFSAFGASAQLDPEKRFGEVGYKKQLSLKDLAAGLPLQVEIIFPVFPGLEVYGSLEAKAGLDIDILLNAKGEGGVWAVGDHANFSGEIGLRAELGVNAGSQLLLALSAGVFAEGKAMLHSQANLRGQAEFDRQARRFKTTEPLVIDYRFKPEAVASIGVVVKAKALYFFNKTIFEYTAAEWRMGHYELVGKIGSKNNAMMPEKPETLGMGKKANPPQYRAINGVEAKTLLQGDQPIAGSGDERMRILRDERNTIEKYLQKLKQRSLSAGNKRQALETKYVALLQRKSQYHQALVGKFNDEQANHQLAEFNREYGIDRLQKQYAELVDEEHKLMQGIEDNMVKLKSLSHVDGDMLEKQGLTSSLDAVENSKSQLKQLHIPDTQAFGTSLTEASDGLTAAIQKDAVVMAGINRVMGYNEFIQQSTTREFLMTTTRKNIVAVDTALASFHQQKSQASVEALLGAIGAYLTNNSRSQRTPIVRLLQHQAKTALESFKTARGQ